MRTTLFLLLAVLAQWGIPAKAQSQTAARPAWSAPNGYWNHPSTKRLYFFSSDPNSVGRPAAFQRTAPTPRTSRFFRPFSFATLVFPNPAPSTLRSPSTQLRPLGIASPANRWFFVKPKNTRLFYFSKP